MGDAAPAGCSEWFPVNSGCVRKDAPAFLLEDGIGTPSFHHDVPGVTVGGIDDNVRKTSFASLRPLRETIFSSVLVSSLFIRLIREISGSILFLSPLPFIHQPSSINLSSPSPQFKIQNSKSKILFLLPLRLCALCARQSSLPLHHSKSKIQNPKSILTSPLASKAPSSSSKFTSAIRNPSISNQQFFFPMLCLHQSTLEAYIVSAQ